MHLGMSFLATFFWTATSPKYIVGVKTHLGPWGYFHIFHCPRSHLSTTSLRYFPYHPTHHPSYSRPPIDRRSETGQTSPLGRLDGRYRIVSYYIQSSLYEISYAHVSWSLDNPELSWVVLRNLLDSIAKARLDRKALVYIGFSSITPSL